MKKTCLLFLVLLMISPWAWVTARNFRMPGFFDERFLAPSNVIEEVNVLQNQSSVAGFGILGKILVNKPMFLLKNISQRYLESFDPGYLFFKGDLDIRKTTGSQGALYIVFIPLILYEAYQLLTGKRGIKRRILFLLLAVAPIPSSIVFVHYETISKIPLLLVLTFLAAEGLVRLFTTKRALACILVFLLFFEVIKFYHDFANHYPSRLEMKTIGSENI